MAGSDPEAWWRTIQAGDNLEIFVTADSQQDDVPRRKSKGREDKPVEAWMPCKVESLEGTGARAKALIVFTDLNGKQAHETIPIKDACGVRLRQTTKPEDDRMKEERAKNKKAKNEGSEDPEGQAPKSDQKTSFQGFTELPDPLIGSRVKVLYDETDWYEGIIRCQGKKPGQYVVAFDEDDEKTTVNIPSATGDVEVIMTKDELCERVKQLSENENSLLNRLLHRALVKSKCLRSNQGLPSPYLDLLASVTSTVIRKIK